MKPLFIAIALIALTTALTGCETLGDSSMSNKDFSAFMQAFAAQSRPPELIYTGQALRVPSQQTNYQFSQPVNPYEAMYNQANPQGRSSGQ